MKGMKIIGSILIAVIGLAAMCLCSLLFPAAISAFVSYVVFVAFYNKKMQKRIAHEEALFFRLRYTKFLPKMRKALLA